MSAQVYTGTLHKKRHRAGAAFSIPKQAENTSENITARWPA